MLKPFLATCAALVCMTGDVTLQKASARSVPTYINTLAGSVCKYLRQGVEPRRAGYRAGRDHRELLPLVQRDVRNGTFNENLGIAVSERCIDAVMSASGM